MWPEQAALRNTCLRFPMMRGLLLRNSARRPRPTLLTISYQMPTLKYLPLGVVGYLRGRTKLISRRLVLAMPLIMNQRHLFQRPSKIQVASEGGSCARR